MKKIKMLLFFITFVVILDLVLIFVFRFWIEMTYRDGVVAFVPSSPYRVVIQGVPAASGKIYWLGRDRHLLVLTPKSSKYDREFYYINMCSNPPGIGLPEPASFRRVPLLGGALVQREVFEGYPFSGELEADWKVNDHEARLRIKGFSDRAQKADAVTNPEIYERLIPIAYQREIIIKESSFYIFVGNEREKEKGFK